MSAPKSKRLPKNIDARLREKKFQFQTDAGLFSRRGIDFGTRLLIEKISLSESASALDLGCGFGPIGISIACFYPQLKVIMADVNKRAVEVAEYNVRQNGLSNKIMVIQSDKFSNLRNMKFDAVITNPPIRLGKQWLYQLFWDVRKHLNKEGYFWLVIRYSQGARSTIAELNKIYSSVEIVVRKKGYVLIRANVLDEDFVV